MAEARALHVPQYGLVTLVVEGTAKATVADPGVASVHRGPDELSVLGRKQGTTSLTIERPGRRGEVMEVRVGEPVPNAYALGVGEDLCLPSGGARMTDEERTSASIATVTTPGDATMIIHAHSPGKTQLLVIRLDGSQIVLDVTVVPAVH